MEINEIKPTAKVTFQVKGIGGKVQAETFEVKYCGLNQIPDYIPKPVPGVKSRPSHTHTEAMIEAVVGWTLTHDGGKPIECNEENKRKYLPYVLGMEIIREGRKPGDDFDMDDVLGWALVNFAGDPENFLKN
jgi:hypothetical protein